MAGGDLRTLPSRRSPGARGERPAWPPVSFGSERIGGALPIDITNPTIVAAAGALFGVFVTLTGQALTGRRQRRHERVNRLFDKKLDLYRELVETLEFSTKVWANTTKTAQALKQELDEVRQVADLNSAMQAYISEHSDEKGELTSILDPEDRELARRLTERYKELAPAREKVAEKAKARQEANGAQIEEFLSVVDRVLALRPQIELVAEERLLSEFALVLQKILLGVEVKPSALHGVKNAARAELGIRDRKIIGWVLKGRRRLALWRFRWKTRGEESLQAVLQIDEDGKKRDRTG